LQRTPVVSDNLASVGYDEVQGTLEIEFRNTRIYEYFRVPEQVYRDLMVASSKGTYFAEHVRDVYRFRRVR